MGFKSQGEKLHCAGKSKGHPGGWLFGTRRRGDDFVGHGVPMCTGRGWDQATSAVASARGMFTYDGTPPTRSTARLLALKRHTCTMSLPTTRRSRMVPPSVVFASAYSPCSAQQVCCQLIMFNPRSKSRSCLGTLAECWPPPVGAHRRRPAGTRSKSAAGCRLSGLRLTRCRRFE